jgi:signal transduction histidine kinase
VRGFGHYYRGRLQRRIFFWFVISIAMTAAVVMLVSYRSGSLYGPAGYERARSFLATQFTAVWDQPERRAALATSVNRDLGLNIRLADPNQATILELGSACEKGALSTKIEREGQVVGSVEVCDEPHHGPRFLIPILVAVFMLSAASSKIARRLVRPLRELARVAEDIGQGRLKSRVQVSRRDGMEFCVVGNVMNEMATRIEKQLADQRALLATVSHEIRTPLSRMRLLIEFAREKTESNMARLADAKDSLGELTQLEREVTEIDALVSDLLASSRIDFTALTTSKLEATAVAKTALERATVDEKRLAAPQGAVEFEGDATLVARAVSNLLENAKRHAGGVEALRVEARPGYVSFVVEDNGPGFAPGEEDRIFEPFYKGPTSEGSNGQSVGLGLALVKRIAEAHRGRVFASNRQGGGARVAVEFAR